jgi:hypothetical protein
MGLNFLLLRQVDALLLLVEIEIKELTWQCHELTPTSDAWRCTVGSTCFVYFPLSFWDKWKALGLHFFSLSPMPKTLNLVNWFSKVLQREPHPSLPTISSQFGVLQPSNLTTVASYLSILPAYFQLWRTQPFGDQNLQFSAKTLKETAHTARQLIGLCKSTCSNL